MSDTDRPGERLCRLIADTSDPNMGLAFEKEFDPRFLDEMEMEAVDDLARAFLRSYGVVVPE